MKLTRYEEQPLGGLVFVVSDGTVCTYTGSPLPPVIGPERGILLLVAVWKKGQTLSVLVVAAAAAAWVQVSFRFWGGVV
jgi:hypothetical protein